MTVVIIAGLVTGGLRVFLLLTLYLSAILAIQRVGFPKIRAAIGVAPWFIPVFTYMVAQLWVALARPHRLGSDGFYEVSAQLLAVFLLAIAIESRTVFQRHVRDTGDFMLSLATFAVLALGGYASLQSIATGDPRPSDYQTVVGALWAGLAGVVTVALLKVDDVSEEDAAPKSDDVSKEAAPKSDDVSEDAAPNARRTEADPPSLKDDSRTTGGA